jgi:hypothetical protein
MTAQQDPNWHPDDGVQGMRARLSGRGCDDLHGDTRIAPERVRSGGPIGPGTAGTDGLSSFRGTRRHGGDQLGPTRARLPHGGGRRLKVRPGWYAYQAIGMAELPSWAVEVALTIERPVDPDPRKSAASVLFRAPLRGEWRIPVLEAVAEVEQVAGVGPVAGLDRVAGARPGLGSRLLSGPVLPGLTPLTPSVAQASLALAGMRGLPAPLRRWRPSAGGMEPSWRWSAGAVLTCAGPCGVSAQAVVALAGSGNVAAITPPPGGALVLRAWRARRAWGVACGLVVGAAAAIGLGREAGRAAARARAEGWEAVLLTGSTALHLARAGSPGQAAPVDAARAAPGAQVAALFGTCLAAGGLGHQPAEPWPGLPITP